MTFLFLKKRLTIQLRDPDIHLEVGELFVVPCGVEYRPVAIEEVHLLPIEPTDTLKTEDERTAAPRQIL